MQPTRTISQDPIYFITVVFFVLLTTVAPALLGQFRFMPILQTLSLAIFAIIPLYQRKFRSSIAVIGLWVGIQYLVVLLLTVFFGQLTERAIPDGFSTRDAFTLWYYSGASLPDGLLSDSNNWLSILWITLGSLLTVGLTGFWTIVQATNLNAFGTGSLISSLERGAEVLRVLPYWFYVRLASFSLLTLIFAQPLITYSWSPLHYWKTQRRLIVWAVALLLTSLVLELTLPQMIARRN